MDQLFTAIYLAVSATGKLISIVQIELCNFKGELFFYINLKFNDLSQFAQFDEVISNNFP